ncbi:MAG: outer membrane lipoprotein carrier protein LolA [Hyphomicrobiales bacterium]
MAMNSMARWAGAFMMTVVAFTGPSWATELTQEQGALLQKVQGYLNDMKNLKGEFTQVGPAGTVSTGVFFISKPGKMRFEYAKPNPYLVVSDGRWVVVKNETKDKADQYPVSSTPLSILLADKVDLANADITNVEERDGTAWVTIQSKDKIVPGQLVLIYDLAKSELQQWIVVDGQGRKTSVSIANLDPSVTPDPSLFKVELPKPAAGQDNN